jgi:hypothetical protein
VLAFVVSLQIVTSSNLIIFRIVVLIAERLSTSHSKFNIIRLNPFHRKELLSVLICSTFRQRRKTNMCLPKSGYNIRGLIMFTRRSS